MHFLSLTNAVADFEAEVEIEDTDPWGDPVTRMEWQVTDAGVEVRFDPMGATFVSEESGEMVHRPARLYAPLWIDGEHEAGDRVTIHYRGKTRKYRMATMSAMTMDGSDGYVAADLADFGDRES